MARNNRDRRQTALTAFEDGTRVLADGGLVQTKATRLEAAPDVSLPKYDRPYSEDEAGYERYEDSGEFGIMYAGEYKWNDVECTSHAYGDTRSSFGRVGGKSHRSLQFHSTWIDAETANQCIRTIGTYNRFDPTYVTTAVNEMPDSARFVVGREASPVIYLWTEQPVEVLDIFEQSGSEAYDRQQELYAELSAIEAERETDETLILRDPADASGRLRDILAELEAIDTFAPGAPDELTAYSRADTYPGVGLESPTAGEAEAGTATLVRAWWD